MILYLSIKIIIVKASSFTGHADLDSRLKELLANDLNDFIFSDDPRRVHECKADIEYTDIFI